MDNQRRESWERWLPLLFLALAFVSLAPLFRHPFLFADKSDWRYFQTVTEVARRSVIWWHQLPLWNPYGCGGEVLLANPQSEVAAPTFLLSLAFGAALGIKLALVVYFFCAFDGMYRLSRNLGIAPVGALLSSVLFGGSGWLALHTLVGHTNFASVGLFPYLVLFYRRSLEDRRYVIAVGGIAAWTIALGGTSTPAWAMVLLLTIAVIDTASLRTSKPFKVLALGTVCAVGFSAFRLFPALEFAIDHPRRQWQTDSTGLFQLITNGYRWMSDDPLPHKLYRFHEYGWRLSYITPPLIVWSLTLRDYRRWWIVAAVGAAIAAGAAIPYGPWWLLKHIPVFRDLRVPSRYVVLLAFSMPILCGAALADLAERVGRWQIWIAVAVIAIAAVDCIVFDWARLREIQFPAKTLAGRSEPFYQVQSSWPKMMDEVLGGHGVISCLEETPLERAEHLELGPGAQAWLADASSGEILSTGWTPNRLTFKVALAQPTLLIVNENWNEHWRASTGSIVKFGSKFAADQDGGQLALRLPTGTSDVTLYYRPRSFIVGGMVTLATLGLFLALLIRKKRRATSASN
jgi:hypothetical protein